MRLLHEDILDDVETLGRLEIGGLWSTDDDFSSVNSLEVIEVGGRPLAPPLRPPVPYELTGGKNGLGGGGIAEG